MVTGDNATYASTALRTMFMVYVLAGRRLHETGTRESEKIRLPLVFVKRSEAIGSEAIQQDQPAKLSQTPKPPQP